MDKESTLKIFVVMHKEKDLSELNLDECYCKLLVGKDKTNESDILLDSTGANISNKNKNYCELTGLYWMWKNIDCDYIGLCHYRRYFVTNKNKKIYNQQEIIEKLKDNDIVLPSKWITLKNVYDMYKEEHYIEDLDYCRDIISNEFPDYIESFDYIMSRKSIHLYNMFITKKELINEYCEWLFKILNILETKINLNERDEYQKRVYGFLSERLFNVWIHKNNLKVFEAQTLNVDKKLFENISCSVKQKIKKIYLKIRGYKNEI